MFHNEYSVKEGSGVHRKQKKKTKTKKTSALQYEENGLKPGKRRGKDDIRMDGMQAIFLYPTQSHVKVHSTSTLAGPRDHGFG